SGQVTTSDPPAKIPTGGHVRRYDGRQTPALGLLRRTAQDLGPLLDRVVFIGGTIAPLLQASPLFPEVRTTIDTDDHIEDAGSRWDSYALESRERLDIGSGFPSNGDAANPIVI